MYLIKERMFTNATTKPVKKKHDLAMMTALLCHQRKPIKHFLGGFSSLVLCTPYERKMCILSNLKTNHL
jgi:hypothetical protein